MLLKALAEAPGTGSNREPFDQPQVAGSSPARLRTREKLKIVAITLVSSGAIAALGAALFIWSGIYSVAATSSHASLTRFVLHTAMTQSVRTHAPNLQVPDLDDPELVKLGAAHYLTGCAPCHGAPDQAPSPIEIGATPPPPPLYSAARDFTPSQLHWIVKHGVKMTAMPPWPTQERNDEIWAMVAFLNALPNIRPGEFAPMAGAREPAAQTTASSLQNLKAPEESQRCAACHGVDGQGAGTKAPKLAGLSSDYIRAQLSNFRDGTRPSGIMRPIAVGLDESAMNRVADYFASRPRQSASADATLKNSNVARPIAHQGLAFETPACDSCHAHPGNASVPQIDGQSRDYLETQLELFRDDIRKGPNSAVMRKIAKALTPAQIKSIAAFYASREVTEAAAK